MARLAGRTAIVTGASRGLGRSIALALAAEGAVVAVVARTEEVWHDKLPAATARCGTSNPETERRLRLLDRRIGSPLWERRCTRSGDTS